MKIILFTKPKEASLKCLQYLISCNDEIEAVVIYRKNDYLDSPFYDYCLSRHIKMMDDNEIYEYIDTHRISFDILYCYTYPRLIRQELIKQAKKAAVNFHPAPLPDYKGPFCFNFAILNEEKAYGVSAHFLGKEFDKGDIIKVDRFEYDCTKGSLTGLVRLSEHHILTLFQEIHSLILNGSPLRAYEQTGGSYYSRKDFENAKKIEKTDSKELINKKIRAFWYPPYEGAYIEIDNRHFTLVNAEILNEINNAQKYR